MYTGQKKPAILIATLGSEPQVVTAALDLLRAKGETVSSVWVMHTAALPETPVGQALQTLRQALTPAVFYPVLGSKGDALADVDTPYAAEVFFRLAYSLVQRAKKEGHRVHLSIAGGRKTMAVFGMAAAQLLFDEDDHLWHLFSSGDFLLSKRLHPAPGDDVRLVEVPVILWSRVTPVFETLSQADDPYIALEHIRELQLAEKVNEARSFVLGSLSAAERRVVELLVREGLSDQELAGRLSLSARTVADHLRSAYNKAELHWEITSVGRGQLIALLNLFYTTESRNITEDSRDQKM